MKHRIIENIPIDPSAIQQGIDALLYDLDEQPHIRASCILAFISPEDYTKINEANTEFFLNIYTEAHGGDRREFTVHPDDFGRLSWLSFMSSELTQGYGTHELNLEIDKKDQLYKEFQAYARNFSSNKKMIGPLNPIKESTKNHLNQVFL